VECQVRIRIDFERARAEVARIHWAPRIWMPGEEAVGKGAFRKNSAWIYAQVE
jgi:hypothetical protein